MQSLHRPDSYVAKSVHFGRFFGGREFAFK
jgi:hypothetical protein